MKVFKLPDSVTRNNWYIIKIAEETEWTEWTDNSNVTYGRTRNSNTFCAGCTGANPNALTRYDVPCMGDFKMLC